MSQQEFPPEVVEAVEWALAVHFSQNRQPCMSGNPRDRLSSLQRRNMENARDSVLRTLHALGYQRVGPGDVVVPREPTEAMVNTGTIVALEHRLERGHRSRYSGSNAGEVYAAYRAMLAAARVERCGGDADG
jgi:hypothetical protein